MGCPGARSARRSVRSRGCLPSRRAGLYVSRVAETLSRSRQRTGTPSTAQAARGTPPEPRLPVGAARRHALRRLSVAIRDARFRHAVIAAHSEKCCVCGIDTGLPQAAHIVPVHAGGRDSVSNGLALCPNHHVAFDRGALLIRANGRIEVNRRMLERLGNSPQEISALAATIPQRARLKVRSAEVKRLLRRRLKLTEAEALVATPLTA